MKGLRFIAVFVALGVLACGETSSGGSSSEGGADVVAGSDVLDAGFSQIDDVAQKTEDGAGTSLDGSEEVDSDEEKAAALAENMSTEERRKAMELSLQAQGQVQGNMMGSMDTIPEQVAVGE